MSLCVFCGHATLGGRDLCAYHDATHEDDWAVGNRLMCDFLHRGIMVSSKPRRVGSEAAVAA
jgi:hypothetical protein